jgi:hypothetical protein
VSARKANDLHAAHARVGNDEFDGDSARAGDGRNIIGLVIDAADNKTEGLLSAMPFRGTHLADGVQRTRDVENALRVAGYRFGHCDASIGFFLALAWLRNHLL